MSKQVVYIPPSDQVLEMLAFQVCQKMGEGYTDPAIHRGLAGFLKFTARLLADEMNAKTGEE